MGQILKRLHFKISVSSRALPKQNSGGCDKTTNTMHFQNVLGDIQNSKQFVQKGFMHKVARKRGNNDDNIITTMTHGVINAGT